MGLVKECLNAGLLALVLDAAEQRWTERSDGGGLVERKALVHLSARKVARLAAAGKNRSDVPIKAEADDRFWRLEFWLRKNGGPLSRGRGLFRRSLSMLHAEARGERCERDEYKQTTISHMLIISPW